MATSRATATTRGRSSSSGRGGSGGPDTSSLEGLVQLAKQKGLYNEIADIVEDKPKLSALQRIGKALGAFNPAEAILTGKEKGVGAGILEYGKGLVQDVGSAITGTDYNPDRRTFRDVAEEAGIDNKVAKFGVGFLGDVLLDPSTYFGGAIARGLTKGAAFAGSKALTTVGKVAPETETGLRMVGGGLKDALGRAFNLGYKATPGAKEKTLSFLSRRQQAQLGLAASNLSRLGTGVLTKTQQEELALKLIAGKRAEFLAREAGKTAEEAGTIAKQTALEGTSKEVREVMTREGGIFERTAKFGEDLGLENPYEVYFPFLKNTQVEKFVNETKGIKVGSEGYRKQFKNLLTNAEIEMDPAKAFFTREAQIVTDRMTGDFLRGFVKDVGRPLDFFENAEEAAKAGFQVIRDKGVFGKELGYLSKYDAALIRDTISPEFQTINMLAKATGFDAITSLFKRSVTGLFAPFHIRNYVSGDIQNYEVLGIDALRPSNKIVGHKIAYLMGKGEKLPSEIIELGGKKYKFNALMKPFTDRFSGDTFYNADFELALKNGGQLKQVMPTLSTGRLKETAKTLGLGQEAIPFKVGRAVGQFIEHQQKATAYVTALSQGRTVKEALALAEKAGFDYRALTRFESQIMRRLIPFYSFTRKNIELQLKTLGENPQRINQVLSFFENFGDTITADEKKSLPDYLKESLGIKLEDTPEGLKQYVASFGTPIEAFAQLFGKNPILRTISQTNPILKVPIELGIGKDSFRQKDLKDVYDAREYKMAPQIVKDLLGLKEVQKDVLTKLPNGKLMKTGTRTQYVADPERLLVARSLFTSRGVSYLDQVFGNDLKGLVKLLKTTTGLKAQQVDLEQQASMAESRKKRAVEDELTKYGATKQFTKTYVPK